MGPKSIYSFLPYLLLISLSLTYSPSSKPPSAKLRHDWIPTHFLTRSSVTTFLKSLGSFISICMVSTSNFEKNEKHHKKVRNLDVTWTSMCKKIILLDLMDIFGAKSPVSYFWRKIIQVFFLLKWSIIGERISKQTFFRILHEMTIKERPFWKNIFSSSGVDGKNFDVWKSNLWKSVLCYHYTGPFKGKRKSFRSNSVTIIGKTTVWNKIKEQTSSNFVQNIFPPWKWIIWRSNNKNDEYLNKHLNRLKRKKINFAMIRISHIFWPFFLF